MFKLDGAIGILEYATIPQGVKVLNGIVKHVKLSHIQAHIFPGAKYMIKMQGEHSSIEYAMEMGMEQEGLLDIGWIGKLHANLLPVLNEQRNIEAVVENVIIFEEKSFAKALELCNMLLHSFDVNLVKFEYSEALQGRSIVVMSGSVAAVSLAKKQVRFGEIITNIEPWILEEIVR